MFVCLEKPHWFRKKMLLWSENKEYDMLCSFVYLNRQQKNVEHFCFMIFFFLCPLHFLYIFYFFIWWEGCNREKGKEAFGEWIWNFILHYALWKRWCILNLKSNHYFLFNSSCKLKDIFYTNTDWKLKRYNNNCNKRKIKLFLDFFNVIKIEKSK